MNMWRATTHLRSASGTLPAAADGQTMDLVYGLWEHTQLHRLARRAGMPSTWEVFEAAKPWERLGLVAFAAAPGVIFGAVWGGTGSVLIAAGAMLLFLVIGSLVQLPFAIRTVLRGEESRPAGTHWDCTTFSYRPPHVKRRAAILAALAVAGSIALLAAIDAAVWLATRSPTWTVATLVFAAAFGMILVLGTAIIVAFHVAHQTKH